MQQATATEITKHAGDCTKAFGRFDQKCPRCRELIAGAPRRSSPKWDAVKRMRNEDERRTLGVRSHFAPGGGHSRGCCGPVCTFGDY